MRLNLPTSNDEIQERGKLAELHKAAKRGDKEAKKKLDSHNRETVASIAGATIGGCTSVILAPIVTPPDRKSVV